MEFDKDFDIDKIMDMPCFKPIILKANPDEFDPQQKLTQQQIFLKNFREMIFNTAQFYRQQHKDGEKEFFEEMFNVVPEEKIPKEAVLVFKLYFRGLQNGMIEYANALISATEQSNKECKK